MALADMRKDYTAGGLLETDVDPEPIAQFRRWFAEAQDATGHEPNAMILATADAAGSPSARTVLLKGLDGRGFVFYSNYDSDKGRAIAENPAAELLFYWPEMERQIRVHGSVQRTDRDETEAYFRSRPRGNQLGALVSPQSSVIANREELDDAYAALDREIGAAPVPLPDHWGGFRVVPEWVEFWQGRKSRLHDRLRYVQRDDGAWQVVRLAP